MAARAGATEAPRRGTGDEMVGAGMGWKAPTVTTTARAGTVQRGGPVSHVGPGCTKSVALVKATLTRWRI